MPTRSLSLISQFRRSCGTPAPARSAARPESAAGFSICPPSLCLRLRQQRQDALVHDLFSLAVARACQRSPVDLHEVAEILLQHLVLQHHAELLVDALLPPVE